MELHPDVTPLSALIGEWEGPGHGVYPTIEPFDYAEVATWSSTGKPWLAYAHRTAIDGQPRHTETGYLRTAGDRRVELVVAMPTGHSEIGIGTWEPQPDGFVIRVDALVECTPTAKSVSAVRRQWRLRSDTLEVSVDMAAVGQPLQRHLAARLSRRRPASSPPGS